MSYYPQPPLFLCPRSKRLYIRLYCVNVSFLYYYISLRNRDLNLNVERVFFNCIQLYSQACFRCSVTFTLRASPLFPYLQPFPEMHPKFQKFAKSQTITFSIVFLLTAIFRIFTIFQRIWGVDSSPIVFQLPVFLEFTTFWGYENAPQLCIKIGVLIWWPVRESNPWCQNENLES